MLPNPTMCTQPTCVQTLWPSPVGGLRIIARRNRCRGLYFPGHSPQPRHWDSSHPVLQIEEAVNEAPVLKSITTQLNEYFGGSRDGFDVDCEFNGTEFQNEVWQYLPAIPIGGTQTYAQVATAIGRPNAIRAVGAAVARNPISIISPCHRVVGSNGKLTGFAGGLDRKRFLLDLEKSSSEWSK